MADLTTVLVTGGSAFFGAAGAAGLKYAFDRRTYDRDNRRRKTEGAIRHLQALAMLIEPVKAGLALCHPYGRQSYNEHLQDARAECGGLSLYGGLSVRKLAPTILKKLQEPGSTDPRLLSSADSGSLAILLHEHAKQLEQAWRKDDHLR